MPSKKKQEESPADKPNPVELPLDAHTYYVWKDGAFVKYFINEEYKGEALRYAKLFAEEVGGTIEASGTYKA